MNWSFKMFWTVTLIASTSFMITACGGKKGKSGLKIQGNVTTDGQSLYSNSTLDGRPIQISVSNILKSYSQTMQYPAQYPSQTSVQFTLNVNGQQKPVQLNVGMQSQGGLLGVMMGDFNIYYDGRCADVACDKIALTLWSSTQMGQQWKQMGVLKVMSQNIIGAGFEITGLHNNMITADQMTAELNRLYAQ